MDWDSKIERRIKNIEFAGGESLMALKAFIADLPDNLPANYTARIELELRIIQ